MSAVWDALVVGGGAAGILAAERLAERGAEVLLLEAGPRLGPGERTPEVDRRAWPYATVGQSYDWYRVRALGGRTLLWGGWCYRFPEPVLARGWPCDSAALAPYYAEAERRLGVIEGRLDERYRVAARTLELSIIPKRGALGLGSQAWTPVQSAAARRARIHTVGLRLEHRQRRGTALHVLDLRDERVHRLRARSFVLAASPVETARILLASELGRAGAGIGRGFVDQMVASYVLVEPEPLPPLEGRGPFPGCALVESFVNLGGKNTARPYPGGFSIELNGPMPLEAVNLERMERGAPGSMRATLIHALGETHACKRRFVDLDPGRRDAIGRPLPRLHLAWSRAERRLAADMRLACTRLADAIAIPGSRLLRLVDPLQAGAGHEAGTCAMGLSDRAPADPWGRVRALDNVWVADASALPTPGDRHPTLTLLAHALRAADDVARHAANGGAR